MWLSGRTKGDGVAINGPIREREPLSVALDEREVRAAAARAQQRADGVARQGGAGNEEERAVRRRRGLVGEACCAEASDKVLTEGLVKEERIEVRLPRSPCANLCVSSCASSLAPLSLPSEPRFPHCVRFLAMMVCAQHTHPSPVQVLIVRLERGKSRHRGCEEVS